MEANHVRDKDCLLFSLAMIGGLLAAGPHAAQTASAQTVSGAGVCAN